MSLKRCPLCGAVNALPNSECFVCTWHGEFMTDPEVVDEGLGELLVRCPELVDAMLYEPPKKLSAWMRLCVFFRKLLESSVRQTHWLTEF